MEKNGEWITPGVEYYLNSPQLPEDGSKVTITLSDERRIPATFRREDLSFIDDNGGRWGFCNPGVRSWSI